MSILLETSLGDITIDFFIKKAPQACENFIKLAQLKFYNNAIFYEVQKDFVVSVKHIRGMETSYFHLNGQEKYFKDEIDPEQQINKKGLICTSNAGPHLNTCNFFITLTDENLENLFGKHTVFGEVVEGLEVLDKINELYLDEDNKPLTNIRIKHCLILDDPFEESKLPIPDSPILDRAQEQRMEYEDEIEDTRDIKEIIAQSKKEEAKTRAIVLEMINDIPDADIQPPDNILFICKLNPVTQEKDLELIFSRFGAIRKVDIIRDWKTGNSLQYGFIEFETQSSAYEAYLTMEDALIDERRIHIDFSQSVQKLWPRKKQNNEENDNLKRKSKFQNIDEQNFQKVELKKKNKKVKNYEIIQLIIQSSDSKFLTALSIKDFDVSIISPPIIISSIIAYTL